MKYSLTIEIPGLPKSTNGSHGHWSTLAKERKKWRRAAYMLSSWKRPPSPLKTCEIKCVRFSSSEPDYDNLAISFKSIIDGLVDAGIMVDDKSSCILERRYSWEKCKPKKGKVQITVNEI